MDETTAPQRAAAALANAARRPAQDAIAAQADREAMAALRSTGAPDGALAALDLEALAGLLERTSARAAAGGSDDPTARRACHDALDLVRRSAVLRRIAPDDRAAWAQRILDGIDASHLTVGPLFRQRAETYGSKTLFEMQRPEGLRVTTWRQAAARVDFLGRALLSLDSADPPARVAILAENRLDTALVDLACLGSGIVDVLLPATSTEADVGYMLRHSHAATVIVSDAAQLRKVLAVRDGLPELRRVVSLDADLPRGADVLTFAELTARALHIPASLAVGRSEAVRSGDLATIMYTSGTTGTPKGIQFSHRNLVFKRFARALALPEIGEQDVFLCFLPLFHTFGRFLELLGCVFWGATYCFLDNPSVEALVAGMRRHRPTVFISVPKKWIQLYEAVAAEADPERASDAELADATRRVTGGRLRWGLSAAGHLDPAVFRFFQRQGIELLSGFGMTEATGGITMTPPGDYRDDSLGVALPGVEVTLADDGELLVRGPYVMLGYLDPEDGEPSFDADGWLHSGDLMEVDRDGHLRLVDRKKEIYKNVKGETIAPQRVESQFRDFESVGRAFLVGDHREYNTLLIWPNPSFRELDLAALPQEALREHFRSLVVSVNKFLAPYERVVDFALIDRDLDAEHGELTAKGTARRSVVARNFAEVIRGLYRRANLHVGDVELTLPNWLFQTLGLTAQDIRVSDGRLGLPGATHDLSVKRIETGLVRVGDGVYRHPPGPLNLAVLLTSPALWLGNEALVQFAPLAEDERAREGRPARGVAWLGWAERPEPAAGDPERLAQALAAPRKLALADLHVGARLLAVENEELAGRAFDLVERAVDEKQPLVAAAARAVLGRLAGAAPLPRARRALVALARTESDARFRETFERFLDAAPDVLDPTTVETLADCDLGPAKLDALLSAVESACLGADDRRASQAPALLDLLAAYGALHPVSFRRIRGFLVRAAVSSSRAEVREHADRAAESLIAGFRAWLGPTARIAVDPETGSEYRWEDVVAFEDGVVPRDRARILDALKRTAFLREAFFLFSNGAQVHLSDIPPGGVWVRLLATRHGKSVYRITVQTRFQGAMDLAANLNQSLGQEAVAEEIRWLVVSGDPGRRDPLVEDFGGYWPEQDLWSEEFIAGETVDRSLARLAREADKPERLRQVWSFLAWSSLAAYVDFWNRTGRRWEIADPSLANVIVPLDDYRIGARIVSLSARRPHVGIGTMLRAFRDEFVRSAETLYPALSGLVTHDVVLSSLLEILGEEEGSTSLERAAREPGFPGDLACAAASFVARTREHGFVPMRLHFAIERWLRWNALGHEATPQARAATLHELYETYGLSRLAAAYPAVRFRFFRDTVFRDAHEPLARGLDELIARIRRRELPEDEFVDAVADLRGRLAPAPDEDYFLARISFPHLRPQDIAGFVSSYLGGRYQSEIVVSLEDGDGEAYHVRHALNPKEVERLYRLFLAAKVEVRFRPEHQYLVALNERGQIIAGIYYETESASGTAHLEKIVVTERYRRKGVADGLMKEFFHRLRAAGVKTVTTGFFRPEYFYGYGFRIEKRYAGLVKDLEP